MVTQGASQMMGREKLSQLKNVARRKAAELSEQEIEVGKMVIELPIQTVHSLIDHGLETLDLIDGGTTAANRNKELHEALAEIRQLVVDGQYKGIVPLERAVVALDLMAGMLTTDYRRYPNWADIRLQIAEEFGE